MGKYIKKHEWGPCEFVYKINWEGKKCGDRCGARGLKRQDGKCLCTKHNPGRIAQMRYRCRIKGIMTLARQEARLQARKRNYGVTANHVAVETEENGPRLFGEGIISKECSIIS